MKSQAREMNSTEPNAQETKSSETSSLKKGDQPEISLRQQQLHHRALQAAHHFRESEKELISTLQQVERARVHYAYGFSSLWDYALRALSLSESNASAYIGVSRKALKLPALQQMTVP